MVPPAGGALVLVPVLQLVLSITTSWSEDVVHESVHRACEELVYEIVAPECGYDDCTTPLGEELAEILCRGEDLDCQEED